MKRRYISAAEVEKFSYCPLSWKLSRRRTPDESETLERGRAEHAAFSRDMQAISRAEISGRRTEPLVLWSSVAASILAVVALSALSTSLYPSEFRPLLARFFPLLALIWLLSASYFLRRALSAGGEGRLKYESLVTLFALVATVLSIMGIALAFTMPDWLGLVLEPVALVWLIGSTVYLYLSLRRKGVAAPRARTERTVLWWAAVATVVALLGLSTISGPLTAPGASVLLPRFLPILALIWLLAAVFFLYKAETSWKRHTRLRYEVLILIFAVAATVLTLMAVSTVAFDDPAVGVVMEVFAVSWLIVATGLLYRTLVKLRFAEGRRHQRGIGEGELLYFDTESPGGAHSIPAPLMVSREFGLRGRPDYLLSQDGRPVPVEVKTGRTPRGPLFSHVMQLAAYCALVESARGRPGHGILKYPAMEFRIPYNPELRTLLSVKLDEIRAAEASGEAHRNHNRPGKCLSCSRREGCPERLI